MIEIATISLITILIGYIFFNEFKVHKDKIPFSIKTSKNKES